MSESQSPYQSGKVLDREASAALIDKIKGRVPAKTYAEARHTPHVRATEAAIVAHAEAQARGREGRKSKRAASGVPARSESAEQCALIRWWQEIGCRVHHLSSRLMFAVPLSALRTPINGARMKAEGAVAGTPDLFLIAPRGGFAGLIIEMKRKPNKPTPEQRAFISDAETEGWRCHICYSSAEAITVIEDYLSHEPTAQTD